MSSSSLAASSAEEIASICSGPGGRIRTETNFRLTDEVVEAPSREWLALKPAVCDP
jgi:hypothetical protein